MLQKDNLWISFSFRRECFIEKF